MRLIFVAEQQHILVCRFTHVYITHAQTPLLPVTSPSLHAFAPLTPWTCWRGAIHLQEVLIHSPLQLREGIPIPMTPPAFLFSRQQRDLPSAGRTNHALDSATDFFRVTQLRKPYKVGVKSYPHMGRIKYTLDSATETLLRCIVASALQSRCQDVTLTWGASRNTLDSATEALLRCRCQDLPSHGAHQEHARQCYGSSSALHSCGSLAKSVSRFTLTRGASRTRSTPAQELFLLKRKIK